MVEALSDNATVPKKRVLCISDSFGLPRPDVPYTSTWISMLKERFPYMDFIGCFRRLSNTDILATSSYGEYLRWYEPHVVIIQLGICDCSPRYLRTTSPLYKALGAIPQRLAAPVWKMIRLRKRSLDRTDVSPDRYRANLTGYISECKCIEVGGVILVKIGIPTEKMRAANPLILESIARFNACIDEVASANAGYVEVADPLGGAIAADYTSDGYHPNSVGNTRVADALQKALQHIILRS